MIFLKKIFKLALITFLSTAIFFGAAYAYLDYSLKNATTNIDKKDFSVQYDRTPQNCGIALVFSDNSAALVYLDFKEVCVRILDVESYDSTRPEYNGYTADYTISVSYELVEGIIDRVGGINIEKDNECYRYTGAQVIDLIAYGRVDNIKKQILKQVFDKISKNSFSKEDIVYIIENSESNLSFVDCIDWIDYLKDMCRRVEFVN